MAGSTAVSKGLFAQAATEQTQQVNAEAIFIERIITPLVQGAGLSLTVGDPAKMDNAQLACRPRNYGMCDDTYSLWLQRQHANNVYRIPVTLTADPGTSEAVWQTASSISKEPCVRLDLNAPQPFEPIEQAIRNFRRTLIDDGHKRYVAVLHRIGESSSGSACYLALDDTKSFDTAIASFNHLAFEITILSKQGEVVEQYLYHPYLSYQQQSRPGGTSMFDSAASQEFKTAVFNGGSFFGFTPPKTQTFGLLVPIPLAVIQRADHIAVKIVSNPRG